MRGLAIDRHRAGERFSPHALKIPQVGQVGLPPCVTALLLGQTRSVGVRVEKLICQGNERCDRLLFRVGRGPAGHSGVDRSAR